MLKLITGAVEKYPLYYFTANGGRAGGEGTIFFNMIDTRCPYPILRLDSFLLEVELRRLTTSLLEELELNNVCIVRCSKGL